MSVSYIAIVSRGYRPLADDNEEVYPSNLGALKKGLQALLKEDAEDDVRAGQKWAEARALLAEESENETGAGAEGSVQVSDDFFMSNIGGEGWDSSYGR